MAKIENAKAKGVPIVLNGRDFRIKYDINAMIELEDAFGSLQEAMDSMKTMQMKGFRKLLWAGLIHNNEISEKEVGSLIDFKDFKNIADKIGEAFTQALPEMSEEDKKEIEKELENDSKNVEKVSE